MTETLHSACHAGCACLPYSYPDTYPSLGYLSRGQPCMLQACPGGEKKLQAGRSSWGFRPNFYRP